MTPIVKTLKLYIKGTVREIIILSLFSLVEDQCQHKKVKIQKKIATKGIKNFIPMSKINI